MIRVLAMAFLAAAVWVPVLRWDRMNQLSRYVAMVALGAAIVFYLMHPTYAPDGADPSGY
jgi:hypothetical protein